MIEGGIVISVVVVVVVGIPGFFIFRYGLTLLWQGILIHYREPADCCDLGRGAERVKGEAIPPATEGLVTSPLTDTECLRYEAEATTVRESPGSDTRSDRRYERDGVPFDIEDGTGRVRVRGDARNLGTEDVLTRSYEKYEAVPEELRTRLNETFAPEGSSFEAELGRHTDKLLRISERTLVPGDTVHAIGWVSPNTRGSTADYAIVRSRVFPSVRLADSTENYYDDFNVRGLITRLPVEIPGIISTAAFFLLLGVVLLGIAFNAILISLPVP